MGRDLGIRPAVDLATHLVPQPARRLMIAHRMSDQRLLDQDDDDGWLA